MRSLPSIAAMLAVLSLTSCGSAPVAPTNVPSAIRAPAGQSLYFEALATGVQIYECAAKADQPTAYEWTFRSPEAPLVDRAGRSLGKHYGGPTWEGLDGSKVVGEVAGRDPGPNKSAIPWLLLNAKSTTGTGVFAQTKSIQRVDTVGGVAPAQPCAAANAKQVMRVPYTATYYYYR